MRGSVENSVYVTETLQDVTSLSGFQRFLTKKFIMFMLLFLHLLSNLHLFN